MPVAFCGTAVSLPARKEALNPETRNECPRCVAGPPKVRWGNIGVWRKKRGRVQHYVAPREGGA